MKKSLLLLLLKFVALTVPLTWLWMNGGQQAYFRVYMTLARPILILLGVTIGIGNVYLFIKDKD